MRYSGGENRNAPKYHVSIEMGTGDHLSNSNSALGNVSFAFSALSRQQKAELVTSYSTFTKGGQIGLSSGFYRQKRMIGRIQRGPIDKLKQGRMTIQRTVKSTRKKAKTYYCTA
jgi:hypothetical protein